jgi:hypothetical protein
VGCLKARSLSTSTSSTLNLIWSCGLFEGKEPFQLHQLHSLYLIWSCGLF